MTKEFKPILIGKYTDRIELQTSSWIRLIFAGNELFAAWGKYFNEDLDLKELATIMRAPDLKFYIQEKFVMKNPKHLDFLNTMNVKISKLIEMIDYPPFDHLIQLVASLKAAIYPDPQAYLNKFKPASAGPKPIPEVGEVEFENWKAKLFDGENFCFTQELENFITESNSVYTRTARQTAAYLYMQRLADTLSVLNDCGLAFGVQDFPRFVFNELEAFNTPKKHSELEFTHRGRPEYPITHFRPKLNILDTDSQILHSMKNLSDEEIDQLIKKLQP